MRVNKCDLCGTIYDNGRKATETDGEFMRVLKGPDVKNDDDDFKSICKSMDLCPKCTKRVYEFIEAGEKYGFDRVEIVIKEEADVVHN